MQQIRLPFGVFGASCTLLLASAPASSAQTTTIGGAGLALKSAGSNVLNQNGYLGTYITLPRAGTVTFTVNALSAASAGATPHMNLVVDDSRSGFDVATTSASDFTTSIALPAGT